MRTKHIPYCDAVVTDRFHFIVKSGVIIQGTHQYTPLLGLTLLQTAVSIYVKNRAQKYTT